MQLAFLLAGLALAISCSTSGGVTCGEGTVLQGDTCVAAERQTEPVGAPPPAQEPKAPVEDPPPKAPTNEPWSYTSEVDSMRSVTSEFAQTRSLNKIDLDFPYNGGSFLQLVLRKGPKFGNDLLLHISRGQLQCGYGGCRVAVKFDEDPVQNFTASDADGFATGVIFLRNVSGFVAKLKKAKRAVIEVRLFQGGARQFEFDVSGLKWDLYKSKSK